jgi:Protein of unknown function (DUF3306)
MSDPENFLTRWSRRKRAAADEPAPPAGDERERSTGEARPSERAADAVPPPQPVQAADAETTDPAFDLSKLPPIESITAETDIRAFLAPGVPADVRLAALRRAWVADPKVRDFVGLNDYDFDFHTPGAIAGFGPLQMTDALRQEVVRIVSAWQPPAATTEASPVAAPPGAAKPAAVPTQPATATEETNAPARPAADASDAGTDQAAQAQDELIGSEATTQRSTDSVASQQEHSSPENLHTLARRGHGRALPK